MKPIDIESGDPEFDDDGDPIFDGEDDCPFCEGEGCIECNGTGEYPGPKDVCPYGDCDKEAGHEGPHGQYE